MTEQQIVALKGALRPFAEYYDMLVLNSYITGFVLTSEQNGKILGHAGIQLQDIKAAKDAFEQPYLSREDVGSDFLTASMRDALKAWDACESNTEHDDVVKQAFAMAEAIREFLKNTDGLSAALPSQQEKPHG